MTNPETHQDGNLPATLRQLEDAIETLTGPKRTLHNGKMKSGPSLYMQLWDAVSGENNNGGGSGGGSKSRPPFWLDAFDLINEIDTAAEAWQPAYDGVPPTVGRLRHLQARKWRPQDTRLIEQYAAAIQAWALSITELMNPTPKWTLPNPCPACGKHVVYRKDSAGETVRQPALQLGPNGCHCHACHTVWAPDKFVFLARVLGSLPDNVLE